MIEYLGCSMNNPCIMSLSSHYQERKIMRDPHWDSVDPSQKAHHFLKKVDQSSGLMIYLTCNCEFLKQV